MLQNLAFALVHAFDPAGFNLVSGTKQALPAGHRVCADEWAFHSLEISRLLQDTKNSLRSLEVVAGVLRSTAVALNELDSMLLGNIHERRLPGH